MDTLKDLKKKTGICNRIMKELCSYEEEVKIESDKADDMKKKGADPYDLKQQENVLGESRMMIPDCRKRLESSLNDLKETLLRHLHGEFEKENQGTQEISDAQATIEQVDQLFKSVV